MVSGQLLPEENCPMVRVGVWIKVRVSFRVGGLERLGSRTISPEENCPPVRVRACLRVSFAVGGNFPRGNCPRTQKNI